MRRSLQYPVLFLGMLFFIGLTVSFGQAADPNKEANSIVQSPSAVYPRVPGIPIAIGSAQPSSSAPTLVFPTNAKTSKAALTNKTTGTAKSKSSSASSGASNAGSSSDGSGNSGDDNRARQGKIAGAVSVPVFTGVFGQGFNDFPFI